ncbi:kinase-like domain-containing protein [Lyophyllum atratum]|nr:kinase-like domain-containing protein [Lyophyllum atratum]
MSTFNDLQLSSMEVQRYLYEIRLASEAMPYGRPVDLHSEHHENVRRRIVGLLSWKGGPTYSMDEAELSRWCEEVFIYLRRFAARTLRRKETIGPERQLCVDAMHRLVEIARDFDDKTRVLQYYDYLIQLCQKFFVSPSSFIIPFPKLSQKRPIETGASAVVCHGFHKAQEVAVKDFRLHSDSIARVKKKFLKEAFILQILHHPNVVPFIGVVQEPYRLCIVLPWMSNGNIVDFLKKNPESSRKELLEQVADGLHFMHQYNVVHGDLKGANVLINDKERACISDFGISSLQEHIQPLPLAALDPAREEYLLRHCQEALRYAGKSQSLASTLSSRMSSFSGAGTYQWMAPERLLPEDYGLSSAKATFPSDVFSFAMLAIEVGHLEELLRNLALIFGCKLYSGEAPYHPVFHIMTCLHTTSGRRPGRPPDVPDQVWTLIEECWRPEPAHRPSIWAVYNRLACLP